MNTLRKANMMNGPLSANNNSTPADDHLSTEQEKHEKSIGRRHGTFDSPVPTSTVTEPWEDYGVPFPRPIPATPMQALMEAAPGADPETSAEELADESSDLADSLQNDLMTLTDRQRDIVEMYAGGMTQMEIANLLNLTQATVWRHIAGAKAKLAQGSYLSTKLARASLRGGRPKDPANVVTVEEGNWLPLAQRASRLVGVSDNATWRAARLFCNCLDAGAHPRRVARVAGVSSEVVVTLADRFRQG